MRFCTTHRACESSLTDIRCIAAVALDKSTQDPCTLVDALIVPKEDGDWPDWARNIIEDATGGLLPNRIVLDALADAARKETSPPSKGFRR